MKESKTVELKENMTNSFLKTVSAFANYHDGQIKFGITDSKKEKGVENPEDFCLKLENKINDCISPKPIFNLFVDQNNIVTLKVIKGPHVPYMYKGKAYKRNDTSTVELDQVELSRLVLEGKNLYYEGLKYLGNQKLTFNYLEKRLIEKLHIKSITKDIIKTLDFFTKENELNNAAALFADNNDFCGVDIVRFGKTINHILDRETYFNQSILAQLDHSISMFKKYYQYEKIEGVNRINKEIIPIRAFREALLNALIHKTWDINSHIKVSMFEDRVEIVSQGGLPSGISKEEYLNGNVSILRNPIIAGMFFRLHYIEKFGTGIIRIKDQYADYKNKPIFEVYENSIKVILPKLNNTKFVTEDEEAVLNVLDKNILMSSSNLAKKTGFSKDKIIRIVNSLIEKNMLEAIGQGRATRYKL